jgi:pentatricopeptide repeat protein
VKVVLDGQGADEMLAGYANFLGAQLASLVRAGRLGSAWQLYRRMPRAQSAGPLSHLLAARYLVPREWQENGSGPKVSSQLATTRSFQEICSKRSSATA